MHTSITLLIAGLLAGFIDSIAGGGGLITLPTLALVMGPGVGAVATNKIVGLTAALVAWSIYWKKGRFQWKESLSFALWAGIGSWTGSKVSPHLPLWGFSVFLFVSCPALLWIVWRKEFWVQHSNEIKSPLFKQFRFLSVGGRIALCGILTGFYDGIWGPGGGTFMFLALLLVVGLPLRSALASGRFINTITAGSALWGYSGTGLIHWRTGAIMAVGIGVGAAIGASTADRLDARLVRPALTVVVMLLLVRLAFNLVS